MMSKQSQSVTGIESSPAAHPNQETGSIPSNIHEKTHLQKLLRPAHCTSRTRSWPVDCSLLQLRSQEHHRDRQTPACADPVHRRVEGVAETKNPPWATSAPVVGFSDFRVLARPFRDTRQPLWGVHTARFFAASAPQASGAPPVAFRLKIATPQIELKSPNKVSVVRLLSFGRSTLR